MRSLCINKPLRLLELNRCFSSSSKAKLQRWTGQVPFWYCRTSVLCRQCEITCAAKLYSFVLPVNRTFCSLPAAALNVLDPQPQSPATTSSSPAQHDRKYLYMFRSEENDSVESYMRDASGYKDTFYREAEDSPKGPLSPSVVKFVRASETEENLLLPVTAPGNVEIISEVLENLKTLSDSELFLVLSRLGRFPLCESVRTPSYQRIWSVLGRECVERMQKWDLNTQFKAAGLIASLKLVKWVGYYERLISSCFKRSETLKKEHAVRALYCLNLLRKLPARLTKFDVEDLLKQRIDSFNHVEVVVAAMACFKTQTRLSESKLLEKVIHIGTSSKQKLDSIGIAAISKFLRFCVSHGSHLSARFWQNEMLSEVDRLSIPACLHLALVGTKIPAASSIPVVEKAVERIERNLQEARLKDLERICLAMTFFNLECSDNLANMILEELRNGRSWEVQEYGRCLPAILHYLSMRGIFPVDLISMVLSKRFRDKFYNSTVPIHLFRELVCLDFCAEVEINGYDGERLDAATREDVLKSHVDRVKSSTRNQVSYFDKVLENVSKYIDAHFQCSKFHMISSILPQHGYTRIVLCTDVNGSPKEIPSDYRSLPEHDVKFISQPSYKEFKFHVLFLCNTNDFISEGRKLTGPAILMIRQLQALGYSPHIVFPPFTRKNIFRVLQQVCTPVQAEDYPRK